ncbi:glycoside hydrolase superfamily [Gymnopilus junonius]|uniref:beta-N-acetylhexosaminidase n=1 Tax=Gymnopilus junonius TaxID=109634 RepID=A0A9P5NQJ5_GYMJU|nr:glycoside hydrolase superfamily [Gymnopilus junonius]
MHVSSSPVESISDEAVVPLEHELRIRQHTFPVDVIKHTLDAMSWVKISTFHWHVVDSQSFPLQIPGFLELSHKAVYNSSSVYTLSDVRDIVAYAAACSIDVIAKINLLVIPLQYRKAILNILLVLKLLPDRLMLSGCFRVPSSRLLSSHEFILSIEPPASQLHLARAATTNFTSGMLAAAPSLFSSHYFRTGGDEVNENCYDDDEETQRELAFDTFTHITHQALRFVGKTPTVWEGWISAHNVASLVKKGYKVIHASNEYFYLDCGAGGWLSQNPLGNSWCNPFRMWQKAYSFGPLAGLEPSRYHLILGGQHLLWKSSWPAFWCYLALSILEFNTSAARERQSEVLNPRAALLSNYEVLTLLRELESDNLLRTKAALRVKKEEEAGLAISYLSADYLPTSSQTDQGITTLVNKLASYELTKSEKLQIVNLAPTLPVELYVIVEELEDRFGDKLEEILGHVQENLSAPQATASSTNRTHIQVIESTTEVVIGENSAWDEVDAVYDDEVFDDGGAGVGVEGDLEMDED